RFTGDITQARKHVGGGLEQRIAGGLGEFGQARAGAPQPVFGTIEHPVRLEPDGQAVGRGPGQSGAFADLGQRAGRLGDRVEDVHGFIEHADAAMLSHESILTSHIVRSHRWWVATPESRAPPVSPGRGSTGPRARGSDRRLERVKIVEQTATDRGPRTLAEKVWDEHVVVAGEGDGSARTPDLIYIDLHLIHEVTSPQAFEGLRLAGRKLRRPDLTIATEDHNVPTVDIDKPIADPVSRTQVDTLRRNCEEFGVRLHPMGDVDQGIVHVVGPQLGLTQPGMTVVCGDSHTSTHGAFGALAMGIGTSEVEHVMATQSLSLQPFKTMSVTVDGALPEGVTAKDLILAVIAQIGTGGGQGRVIEYRGEAIEALSMEARMTVCNMSIEAGARAGMIAPDETTFAFLKGRPHAP